MPSSKKNTSVVILSAGISARMQTDKAFLKVDSGQTFLEKIIQTYISWGVDELVLVTNDQLIGKIKNANYLPESVRNVLNKQLGWGRFYSVKLGLQAMKNNNCCFIQNIDNPFTEPETLDLLFENREEDATIVPVFEGRGGHPVLLGTQIINHLLEHRKNDEILKDFLGRFKVRKVETDTSGVLTNINNPADYDKFVRERS
ncbi:MAG: NTP transferase domain-containing protein [Bacteroidales bacterium]|nr:NTP transferase domain-containing protein [Bacteroidales bacterium]